jgi:adenylate cyclase
VAPHGDKRQTRVVMMGDIVGYSRLMEVDEDDTHERIQHLKTAVVIPSIRQHSGLTVKEMGDGFLAAFDRPVDAIQSAIDLQTGLIAEAVGFPPERRVLFRIALNICDVIVETGDIFGDGVNIAARLQTFAEPGDIIMTAALAELTRDPLAHLPWFDMGALDLKNISRTIHAYGLRIGSLQNLSAPVLPRAADGRPSIAVLPFRKPPGQTADAYVADAIAEEVIHGLAATQGLVVISRGSTRRYAGRNVDARKVGQELSVRYVLGGAIQRSGDKLRVTTELTDADNATIVRHDRFDGTITQQFELQERIAATIMKTVAPNILDWELRRSMRKRPENLSAYELVLRAQDYLFRLGQEAHARARGLLQQAMAIDPDYAPAYSYTAYWHIFHVGEGWSTDPVTDGREAARMARAAIDRDAKDGLAMAIYGHVQSYLLRDFEGGNSILDRAIEVAPNCAWAWSMSSMTRGYLGDGPTAVDRAETGLRLSPLDGHVFWFEGVLGQAHYTNGDYQAAVAWARRVAAQNPSAMFNLRTLAASLIALGRQLDARRVAADILLRVPNFCLADYKGNCPFTGQMLTDWISRLRAAGLPESRNATELPATMLQ